MSLKKKEEEAEAKTEAEEVKVYFTADEGRAAQPSLAELNKAQSDKVNEAKKAG